MSIFEALGLAWVIFSSALATVGILYLAFVGLKVSLDKAREAKETDVPVEVKEMFKIAR
jgi:archaellum component FlaF (FlaF/FlaG flagellin family)